MKLYHGSEAIAFQVGSPFGKELEAIFQSFIDLGNEYNNARGSGVKVKPNPEAKAKYIYDQIISQKLNETLIACVKNHTGLMITKLDLTHTNHSMFQFACMPLVRDILSTLLISYRNQGNPADEVQELEDYYRDEVDNYTSLTKDELNSISKGLNKQTGKYEGTIPIKTELYLDLYSATCLNEIMADKVQPMTAKELTAICLHEFGHTLILVERAANIMCNIDRGIVTVNTFLTSEKTGKAKVKTALNIIEKYKPQAVQLFGEKLISAFTASGKYYLDNVPDEETWRPGSVNVFFKIIFYFMKFLVSIGLSIIGFVFINAICLIFSPILLVFALGGGSTSRIKGSDIAETDMLTDYIEKWADEYSTRHGYGAYLASGLDKIIAGMHLMHAGSVPFEAKHSKVLNTIITISNNTFKILDSTPTDKYTGYPKDLDRIMSILHDHVAMFKQHESISKELLKEYLDQYDELVKHVEALKEKERNYKYYWIPTVYMFVASFTKAIGSWKNNGKVDEEYYQILNRVEALINNKLFASSAKISLVNK